MLPRGNPPLQYSREFKSIRSYIDGSFLRSLLTFVVVEKVELACNSQLRDEREREIFYTAQRCINFFSVFELFFEDEFSPFCANMYILFLDCRKGGGPTFRDAQVFSTFSRDTQKGTSTRQDPVTLSQEAVSRSQVYTGFSKETALSTRVDAFTSAPLYRDGTCLRTGTLPKCTSKCLRRLCCGLLPDEFSYIRKYREERTGRGCKYFSGFPVTIAIPLVTIRETSNARDSPLTFGKEKKKKKEAELKRSGYRRPRERAYLRAQLSPASHPTAPLAVVLLQRFNGRSSPR